jgi:hypothetical protein
MRLLPGSARRVAFHIACPLLHAACLSTGLVACGGSDVEDGGAAIVDGAGGASGAAMPSGHAGAGVAGQGGAASAKAGAGGKSGHAGAAGKSGQGGIAGFPSQGIGGASAGKGGSAGGGGATNPPPPMNSCPAVTYPSGVTLQLFPDAAFTAQYANLGVLSCALPSCFIDVLNLVSPDGTVHDVHVALATHFELYEMVREDVDPHGTGGVDPAHAYTTKVLVDPGTMAHLESMRQIYGGPVDIWSGFRSPQNQKATCQSICGQDYCADGSCLKNSRHMWGAAADVSLDYTDAATKAGFAFVYQEAAGGAHLHVDMQSCN